MKIIITLLSTLLCFAVFSQEAVNVETDSSVITTRYFPDINSERVFNRLNYKPLCYYTEYYLDKESIKKKGVYSHGYPIGIWEEYNTDGKLIKQTNYNDSVWCYDNRDKFRFYDLQLKMKLIGDSLICNTYSKKFFKNHVEFNSMQSSMKNKNEYALWYERINERPTGYSLYYDFKLDNGYIYNNMIRINLDTLGRYIASEADYDPQGFEKLPKNSDKNFTLNHDSAFATAKHYGLVETDSTKARSFFKHESSNESAFYNLTYKFYIIQKYKSEKIDGKSPHYLYHLIDYYNVWIFNPWSAEFIEHKEMKTDFDYDGGHGNRSGLIDK
jgi:hypothetical protein